MDLTQGDWHLQIIISKASFKINDLDPSTVQLLTWTSEGKFIDTTGKSALRLVKLPKI